MKKQQQFFAFPVKLSKSTCAKFCNDNGINCVTVCVQNQIPTLNSCCLLHQSVPSIQPVWLYLYSTCVQDPTGLVRPPINHWKHMFLCLAAETIQSKLGGNTVQCNRSECLQFTEDCTITKNRLNMTICLQKEEQMLRGLTFKCKIKKIVLVTSLKYTPVTQSILCLMS